MRIDKIKLIVELKKREMTQKKLSEISGVSRMTVNGIVAGRQCSSTTAFKIAKALNIDVTEILESERRRTNEI